MGCGCCRKPITALRENLLMQVIAMKRIYRYSSAAGIVALTPLGVLVAGQVDRGLAICGSGVGAAR